MGSSAIYQLPWPELPYPADGPDGYMDLANAIESKMTRWRSELNVAAISDGWQLTPGTRAEFWKTTVDVGKGWVEVDLTAQFFGQGGCVAADVHIIIDGAICRSWYISNNCNGINVPMTVNGSAAMEFPNGKKGVTLLACADIAPNGSHMIITTAGVRARQFGAG